MRVLGSMREGVTQRRKRNEEVPEFLKSSYHGKGVLGSLHLLHTPVPVTRGIGIRQQFELPEDDKLQSGGNTQIRPN